jgi:membrane-bound lytic murein transglycosylase B
MRSKHSVFKIIAATLFCIFISHGSAYAGYEERDEVKTFISMMVDKHSYDRETLTDWFRKAVKQEETIKSLDKPAESMPWHRYRKIFMTEKRINQGIEFWRENKETLERAEATYGVPPEMITAIIGVETFYGKYKGKFPVFDTLVTIAFDYPKRASFFKKELEQYLLLIREEALDAHTLKGSYAGALGKPQFISSSYRHYAVDFDGDGKRDLLNNTADAIGSVANYFKQHGWNNGDPVVVTASYKSNKKFSEYAMKPEHSVSELSKHGIFPSQPVVTSSLASPIQLEQADHMEYWLGLHNFYVITRYNHSNLYAMAAYQLSQSIKQGMN